jgi:hypothetical protein
MAKTKQSVEAITNKYISLLGGARDNSMSEVSMDESTASLRVGIRNGQHPAASIASITANNLLAF